YFAAYLNERLYRHRIFFSRLDKSIVLDDVIEKIKNELSFLAGHEDIFYMPIDKDRVSLVCNNGGISMSIPLCEKNVFTDVLLSCETHLLENRHVISEYENRLFEEFLPRATEITVFPVRGAFMARCYDFFECHANAAECPVLDSNDKRCWNVSGTYCKGKTAGNVREKLMRCVYCDMFVPVGVFIVDSTRRRYFGAGIDINAYDYMLESVSYVISNAKLHAKINEIPEADPLTGLVSKRTFYRLLADEMKRAQRYSRNLGLFIIDIDHLKKYNDVNGHAQGDILLKSAADIISESVRSVDVVGRYGGDEFIVLLPETEKEEAKSIAERIRYAVEDHRFPRAEHSHGGKVTVSIGAVIACMGEFLFTRRKIIRSAEDALYNARRMGGNRVVVFDKGMLGQRGHTNDD
ncbi:MAG TPA: hypothetical protein DHW81_02795, partial [Nitrospiraceae bacterium]|nr:hypothetical protein [Nitrospiraceae bacterium]